MQAAAIELSALEKRYGDVQALRGIDLVVQQAEQDVVAGNTLDQLRLGEDAAGDSLRRGVDERSQVEYLTCGDMRDTGHRNTTFPANHGHARARPS